MFPAEYHPTKRGVSLPLAVDRYLEVALYLLVATGFATLASTGGLDAAAVILVGVALVVRGWLIARRRTVLIPEAWTTALTLIYVAFYLADYFLISASFMTATVHLVLFVMVVRLFSARRDRDFYFLAVIGFLMVLAAAVLTVDSQFLLAFAGFLLTAVVTFILMEMRYAAAKATVQCKESSDPWAHRHLAFSLLGTAPAIVLCVLLGATAIFFVLPRMSAGYLSSFAVSNEVSTGFSDRVQLGRIGQIQQSSAVVMHIQIDGDTKGSYDLKWRGVALNNFDGKAWSNPHEKFVIPRQPDGTFPIWDSAAPRLRSYRPIHYRVLMEPIGTDVFFLAAQPRTLEGNYRQIAIDGGDAVFNIDPEHMISRYEASSLLPQSQPADLRAASANYPPELLLSYLQLPALDLRIPQLAGQITASATNNYDRASAIENYLRTHFQYTLEQPRNMPRDPLAAFLFERKAGHCEYFASAMAVMLRSLKIPSRVINGFRTGEFNDLTSQYVIRSSNAHAWVEAYFPGYGWVSFDPTPAATLPTHNGWDRFALYMDAMASFWREWVINYDVGHQQRLGQGAAQFSRSWSWRARRWMRHTYQSMLADARHAENVLSNSPGRWSIGAALACALLVLASNARRLWRLMQRARLAAHPERAPSQAAGIWYERMLRLSARLGWKKSPAQTPAEFLTSIDDGRVRDKVAQFTRHYENARFGESTEDAQRLPELYEEIVSAGRER